MSRRSDRRCNGCGRIVRLCDCSPRWFEVISPTDKTGAHRVGVEPSAISDGAFLTMGQDGEWAHAHLSKPETQRLIHHLRQTIGE